METVKRSVVSREGGEEVNRKNTEDFFFRAMKNLHMML